MGEEEKVGGYVSVVFGHPMVRNTQIERDSSDMNVSGEYSILMLVHGSHVSTTWEEGKYYTHSFFCASRGDRIDI